MTFSYNIESSMNTPPSNVSLKKHDGIIVAGMYATYTSTTSTSSSIINSLYNRTYSDPNSGVALTDQRNQPSISMNFPYYSQYNFQLVDPLNANYGTAVDGSNFDNTLLQICTQQVSANLLYKVNVWAACGPDYNFFFFLNTPSLYSFTIPSGP